MNAERPYSVSAVITTYKRPWESIVRAITSIEAQSYPVDEILLVDDNPLPNAFTETIQVGASLHPLVRYISLEGNFGVGAARNAAVRAAGGDLIGFLDDDDEWLPDKIEKQVNLFVSAKETGKDVVMVYGMGRKVWDDTGEIGHPWSRSIFKEYPSFQDMLRGDRVGSASHPLIRRDVMLKLGGFREDRTKAVEDYEMWIRLSEYGPIRGTFDEVYIKHMDAGEHVSTGPRVFSGYIRIYKEYKKEYAKLPVARERILRNIVRIGLKGKNIRVLTWVPKWVVAAAIRKAREARR